MIEDLIIQREYIQQKAISEVSARWGKGQTISGPFLSIPFDKYIKQYNQKDSINEIIKIKDHIHFLPERLEVKGTITPEKRYRGIYEVVVYDTKLLVKGYFSRFHFKSLDINPKNIHLGKAMLSIGITDLKGIEKQVEIQWNGKKIPFGSGVNTKDIVKSGINVKIPISIDTLDIYNFSTEIDLKGSQFLYFHPVGKITDVTLQSYWKTPSFTGMYLPDSREVTKKGFQAHWNILHLNRNYPQSWIGSQHKIGNSSFGTDLLIPVDNYKKSYRVAKYAILFLVLTFMVFFFVEVLNKVFIHPIQYLLVGIALTIFYTLLLSLSEHIRFNWAYIVSLILTLSLITAYIVAILKSKKIAVMIFGILLILYLFIFIIIQLEDYALLIGSLGIFIIVSIVMYFSRKIDWYNLKLGK